MSTAEGGGVESSTRSCTPGATATVDELVERCAGPRRTRPPRSSRCGSGSRPTTPTALDACAAALAGSFRAGGRLFTFGNGGSSTDAQAVAQLFLDPGSGARALPAVALTDDVAVVTALSNDVGFEVVFARQLAAFARPGDVAVGLSTSGGSANVLAAFAEARRLGLVTVGFAGYDGGRMAEAAAPAPSTTSSWCRRRRCTGSRRRRRPRTTCSGSSSSTCLPAER